jgi:hypothetical protein
MEENKKRVMMKYDQFLSLRDYFNYYVAGVVWCADFIFAASFVLPRLNIEKWALRLGSSGTFVDELVGGMLIIIVPYVIGFTLLPAGECVRKWWQGKDRKWRPDPREGLLNQNRDPNINGKNKDSYFDGKRLEKKETARILCLSEKFFGYTIEKQRHLYFYPIRAYIEENGGAAAGLATRARDLTNFMESLLLPVPLLIFTMGIHITVVSMSNYRALPFLSFSISVVIFFGILAYWIHRMLVDRYFQLEMYWVKHVYRAFLIQRNIQEALVRSRENIDNGKKVI